MTILNPKNREQLHLLFLFPIAILDGKNIFQCFWSDPKTQYVFCTIFLRLCTACVFAIYLDRNRSGVVELFGREPLIARESRERHDKIVSNFSPEKQEKRSFGLKFSTFLSKIACCLRESTSAWQNFRQKEPKKKKKKWGLRFFFKSGRVHPVFNGEFPFFWLRKILLGRRRVKLQNWLASDPGCYYTRPMAVYISVYNTYR